MLQPLAGRDPVTNISVQFGPCFLLLTRLPLRGPGILVLSLKAGETIVISNAVTHGLTAGNIVARTGDEKSEFEAIRDSAYAECKPVGTTEVLLVDRIVYSRCSLVRVTRLLGELETGSLDDVLDPEYARPIARLNRYYAMHERSLYRALRTLRAEQTNRGLREASLGLANPAALPPLADAAKILKPRRSARSIAESALADCDTLMEAAAAEAEALIASGNIDPNAPLPPAMRKCLEEMYGVPFDQIQL